MIEERNGAKNEAAERILEAAQKLFYRNGIQAVGMDAIKVEADVALATLYKHFSSKDELVEAYLRRRDERWRRWLKDSVGNIEDPKEQLLAIFDALGEWFGSKDFRGCAFINAAGEIGTDKGSAGRLAGEHKRAVREYIERLVAETRFSEPEKVAGQLMLLMEGAIVTAYVEGDYGAAWRAKEMAEVVLQHEVGS